MRRLFYLAIGVGIGVAAVAKASKPRRSSPRQGSPVRRALRRPGCLDRSRVRRRRPGGHGRARSPAARSADRRRPESGADPADAVSRDPPPLAGVLRAARHTGGAVRVADLRRPVDAVHVAGMLPFIPYFLGEQHAAVAAGHQRAEVRPHPRHRRGRQDHPARHVLPDVRQLLVRRLLQGRRHRVRLGAAHQLAGRRRLRASTRQGSGSPSTRTTTRRRRSGARSPALPDATASSGGQGGQLLVDRPARPLRARARRSTTTAAREFGAGGRPGRRRGPRYLEIWNLVFMQYERRRRPAKEDFRSLGELPAKNIDTGMGLERMAAILQGVDNLYEIDRSARHRQGRASSPASATAPTTQDDVRLRVVADHVARSPHADRRRRHARPTRAAATCCAGCCAASSARCACSASTSPSCAELLARRSRAMSPHRTRSSTRDSDAITPDRRRRGGVVPRARCAAGTTDLDDRGQARPRRRAGRCRRRATPSRCTTPTASRST